MKYITLVTGFAVAFVHAAPSVSYSVYDKIPFAPEGYKELSTSVDPARVINLQIHLAEQNTNAFHQKLLQISDPNHNSYGKHMSQQEVEAMLAPKTASVKAIQNWLKTFDFTEGQDLSVDGQWIKLQLKVSEVEKLLQTKYKLYKDTQSENERIVLRTLEYSLPADLHKHIDMIQPTNFYGMRPHRSHLNKISSAPIEPLMRTLTPTFNLTACNDTISPACLAHVYGFEGYTPKANSLLGVTGYLEQYAQYDDLDLFLKTFAPEKAGNKFTWEGFNNGTLPQNATVKDANFPDYGEANLDIQYTEAISGPIQNIFYSTAGRPPSIDDLDVDNDSEPYLDFITAILKKKDADLPQTLTTSYGENEQTIPPDYAKKVCGMFAQLGARGVSVIFSSGDSGPGWSCKSNDGKGTKKFLPQFPASCPFVPSVGGTWHLEPEEAVFFSSGGFSEYFPMPEYQATQLSHYYRKTDDWKQWKPYFNKGGRGFPDVSGQANKYQVVYNGKVVRYRGTSCSAPMFAAIISLLNSELISRNRAPLGFLNPWLYSRKVAPTFTDITNGASFGCNGTSWGSPIACDDKLGCPNVIPGAGWKAVQGWDPVTGLGTPNFQEMLATLPKQQ